MGISWKYDCIAVVPDGFRILDAGMVTDRQKGWAHGKAFGYYGNDRPDDDDWERYRNIGKRAWGKL